MRHTVFRSSLLLLALSLGGAPAWSQGAADAAANESTPDNYAVAHQRIESLRDQKSKVFDEQERACASKFAVTDCENTIKAQRREMLADLKRQELKINDAQRKEKAAAQLRRDADKAADNVRHEADVQAQTEHGKTEDERQKEQDEKVLNHKKQTHAPEVKAPKTSSAPDAATAVKNRAAYADKLKELERRRQERDKTVQQHGTSGPPLPQPPQ